MKVGDGDGFRNRENGEPPAAADTSLKRGMMVGTPAYVSPEHKAAAEKDHRSDDFELKYKASLTPIRDSKRQEGLHRR